TMQGEVKIDAAEKAGQETAIGSTQEDEERNATDKTVDAELPSLSSGIHLPDDMLIAVENRSNEYYFPEKQGMLEMDDSSLIDFSGDIETPIKNESQVQTTMTKGPSSVDASSLASGIDLPDSVLLEVENRSNDYFFGSPQDGTPDLVMQAAVSPFPPSLISFDDQLFGPEDTDQRSARLYEKVELIEASSELHHLINRPSRLSSDANEEALVEDLAKRTSPEVLQEVVEPQDLSPPHEEAPSPPVFHPSDLQSLLRPVPPPFGEVRLISAEEGIERFPVDFEIHGSRSLDPSFISVDLPSTLPTPGDLTNEEALIHALNKRTSSPRYITEETITTTVEGFVHVERLEEHPMPSPHHFPSEGVKLVSAEDGTFNVPGPVRFETWLSLEPPGDEEEPKDEVGETSVASPPNVDSDTAELTYYRISQDAAPSLESSGEFEGLPQEDSKLMSISEILRLTSDCDRTTSFGLDVIQEESEAEKSGRSSRYEIARVSEVISPDEEPARPRRPSEVSRDASEVARTLLDRLREDQAHLEQQDTVETILSDDDEQHVDTAKVDSVELPIRREMTDHHIPDSDSEGEVEEWGQAKAGTTSEPFADDLAMEDENIEQKVEEIEKKAFAVEALSNSYYSIRDFALTPDAGEVYDSDGANPASYRSSVTPVFVIPPRAVDEEENLLGEEEEEVHNALETGKRDDEEEYITPSRDVIEDQPKALDVEERKEEELPIQVGVPPIEEASEEHIVPSKSQNEDLEEPAAATSEIHEEPNSMDDEEQIEKVLEKKVSFIEEKTELDEDEDEFVIASRPLTVAEEDLQDELPIFKRSADEGEPLEDASTSERVDKETPTGEVVVPSLPVDNLNQAQEPEIASPSSLSELEKSSDDADRPTSTSSSPADEDSHLMDAVEAQPLRSGVRLSDEVLRAVEERSNEYYGFGKPSASSALESSAAPPGAVQLVAAVDVIKDDNVQQSGEVKLVSARDAFKIERQISEYEKDLGAEVEIQLEHDTMDSPIEQERQPDEPAVNIRLVIDSKQPSLDRQSSLASGATEDELDRSSLMKLRLENNLERATSSHGERMEEINVADVERFWEYRYNKSPRTMKELEDAKRKLDEQTNRMTAKLDEEIEKKAREKSGVNLDEEINRKLSEAEKKFLPRDSTDKLESMDTERLHVPSSRSSPSYLVDRFSPRYEDEEDDDPGLPLTSSGQFFHLRSSSSSSAAS
ncbi:hypothetical protein PFISCL1PPCAC_16817, partial [Pristionchus fissidentatus]